MFKKSAATCVAVQFMSSLRMIEEMIMDLKVMYLFEMVPEKKTIIKIFVLVI